MPKVALLLILLLLAGCSRIQFVYNQLDWLGPFYLNSYVGLNDEQYAYLETEVTTLLQWHCGAHLREYARLLLDANADFQARRITATRLAIYTERIEQYWFELVQRALPAIANLLRSASDEQVDQLFLLFHERNQELRDRFAEGNRQALTESYRERMTAEFNRWVDLVTPQQERLITDWAEQLMPLGESGLAFRIAWQNRLRSLLAKRQDGEALLAGLEELVINADVLRSPAYQVRFEHNLEVTIDLVTRVGQSLTASQLAHLAYVANGYANDFDALACQDAGLYATDKASIGSGTVGPPRHQFDTQ
jgi:hypothetical protein